MLVVFSAITPGQRVHEAKEWFIRRLSNKEAGPLKFPIRRAVGQSGDVAIPDNLRLFPGDGLLGNWTPGERKRLSPDA